MFFGVFKSILLFSIVKSGFGLGDEYTKHQDPSGAGGRVLHFSGAAVGIQPVPRVDDERWVWHIALAAQASGFLNDRCEGAVISKARHAHLLALFRLEFRDPADMLERCAEVGRHECCYELQKEGWEGAECWHRTCRPPICR
jgi:hypothetical protein